MSLPVPLSFLRINDQAYLVPRLVAKAILNTYEAGRALASAHHDTNRIAATPGQARVWDRCRIAAPRVARTSGLVLDKAGRQCTDSAPGLDGLPYAAYRAAPNAAFRVLTHRLHKALVFIPKADAGSYADNFRPLGLPNTADRIIDQAVYVQMYSALRDSLS